MQGILYEEASIWQFYSSLRSRGLDGVADWQERRGKLGWRSGLVIYVALLGWGIRFIHHALFNGTMFTLQYYIVDTLVLLLFATAGFRYYRTKQMASMYYWLYEKTSPFSWKAK